jgi:penicillin-binding protein 1A
LASSNWWLDDKEAARTEQAPEVIGTYVRPKIRAIHYAALTLLLFIGFVIWFWFKIGAGLPSLDQLENPKPELATRIISSDGEVLDQYYIKNRSTVHLRDVPHDLVNALIATEDRDFYHHWGINVWGGLRAIWADVVTLSHRQGASTITQQLARNLYFSPAKNWIRKAREAASAIQIERSHTKNEILEMYLNVVSFGRGAYGVEAASQVYFAKDVSQLTPAESAYLVGILKGPENYDPDDDYDHAVARRNTVLDNMVSAKYLTKEQAEEIKKVPLKVKAIEGYHGIAPHFAEMIRQDLTKRPELKGYDIYRDGLLVYTTLNAQMQRAANRAVTEHLESYQKEMVDKRWNWSAHAGLLDTIITKAIHTDPDYKQAQSQAAKEQIEHDLRGDKEFIDSVKAAEIHIQTGFVCLDQSTGQILAMVGSSNFASTRYGLNHVTQILRQPGSTFKAIVFASAFEHGSTPESIVSNEPISMRDGDHWWTPGNFEGEASGGSTTIRNALMKSINLCAIHGMLDLTSTVEVVRMAHRMGIHAPIPIVPSIALGTAEVSPLELTSAYGIFGNEGVRAVPYAIVRVEDRNGKVLYRAKPQFENVLEPNVADMMSSALADVVDRGTGSRIRSLGFNYPAAGKTGTTQNYADAWFVGYTPLFAAGVWVGFDDKRVLFTPDAGQGAHAAAPIWGKFMKYTYEALKPKITPFTHYTPVKDTSAIIDTSLVQKISPIEQRPINLPPAAPPIQPKAPAVALPIPINDGRQKPEKVNPPPKPIPHH